jgi:cytochrome c-type biogenesis protein CcmH
MIGFWIAAALLLLLAYALFAPLLWGKVRRSAIDRRRLNLMLHRQRSEELAQETEGDALAKLQAELDKDLLGDLAASDSIAPPAQTQGRASLIAGLLVAPLLGLLLYSQIGRPDLSDFRADPQAAANANKAPPPPDGLEEMIGRLAMRLEKEPADLQGWMLLGRSYQEVQRYELAAAAYEKALGIEPGNIDVQGYYAEALAAANDGEYGGRPAEIAADILKKNPKHHNALWIAAAAAAQGGNKAQAIAYLQTLQAEFPKESQDAKHLGQIIAQVKGEAIAAQGEEAAEQAAPETGEVKKSIQVKVSLAAALQGKASMDDTVFIFARAAAGPPMPLAIVRKKVRELPLEVTLDDSMSMMQGMNLSAFDQLVIGARISKTGQALPQPGDLQGLTAPTEIENGKAYAVEIKEEVK